MAEVTARAQLCSIRDTCGLAGGGGGGGGVGVNSNGANSVTAGAGGAGATYFLSGPTATIYGGGGGGSCSSMATAAGAGGAGGGGVGGFGVSGAGNGVNGLGGGSGAGGFLSGTNGPSGTGGSGVVIVRFCGKAGARDMPMGAQSMFGSAAICPTLSAPTNGATWTYTKGQQYQSVATTSCNTGFYLASGTLSLTCSGTSAWTGTAPTCTGSA